MNSQITQLSIKELLGNGDRYVIPMYQRNYAWEEGEITQLIQDVIDYLPKGEANARNYYMGTLVVYARKEAGATVFETIDGQQRLTTLSLLTSWLKNDKGDKDDKKVDLDWYSTLCIHFDSREHSRATFAAIFEGAAPDQVLSDKQINTGILNGYKLIKKVLPQKLKENGVSRQQFADFLLKYVQIMRVAVPADTDLNHYFEIMNNRGEQLEKHEVLKARMMQKLNGIDESEESQNCLHAVWEACADMERYVQMGFLPNQRTRIFGDKDWGRFELDDFDALSLALQETREASNMLDAPLTLDQIIAKGPTEARKDEPEEEAPERFNAVINFPNFLLHVLRVATQKDIPLDDKRLLDTFETHVLNHSDPVKAVKQFIFNLLRCRYLLDQYVIKREYIGGKDGWSLKRCKWNDGGKKNKAGRSSYVNTFGEEEGSEDINRQLLMLLSAFHVSTPTLVYKHWLNAALHYLFYAGPIKPKAYLKHMKSVAKAFVFDRFLADGPGAEYFTMIYQNKGICQASHKTVSEDLLKTRLTFGSIENNLVFNFLDYLLWLKPEHKRDQKVQTYEFTFRSSVEHYYPQHPLPGHDQLNADDLHSFGNLCLISHEKNSRLSNFMPVAKKEFYQRNTIDSVKQHLMMQREPWNSEAINEHYDDMKSVLLGCLQPLNS